MAVNSAEFRIVGIDSEDDVAAIEEELADLNGVMGTEIDPETGETEIEFDVDILAEERIEITVREMGYETE